MGVLAKRSSMTFFSDGRDHLSHRVRIVLAEKGVTVDIVDADPAAPPSELADINPYNSLPTLVDRELVLYEPNIMMEYLDERFPHPPLLPVYPVARAESRQFVHRIERDWEGRIQVLRDAADEQAMETARKALREDLRTIAPIFAEKPFFMSEEFSLVDCCMAPILWRLEAWGIELGGRPGKLMQAYAERLFERDSFQASLSEVEQEMR